MQVIVVDEYERTTPRHHEYVEQKNWKIKIDKFETNWETPTRYVGRVTWRYTMTRRYTTLSYKTTSKRDVTGRFHLPWRYTATSRDNVQREKHLFKNDTLGTKTVSPVIKKWFDTEKNFIPSTKML